MSLRTVAGRTLAGGILSLSLVCIFSRTPVWGALSVSGEYELESSVLGAGGGSRLTGGEYSSLGAVGQPQTAGEGDLNSAGPYVNRLGFNNPPHFTFQKGLASVVNFNSGSASFSLPPGAVDKEVFDITLNYDPMAQPLSVLPGVIDSANSKMERNEGSWARVFPGQITELSLFDEQDAWDKPFVKSAMLAMAYKDNNADGILDGSNPPVRVDTVKPWQLDEALGMWARLPGSVPDQTAQIVFAPVLSPGVFALLGMVDDSVKATYAFPVPFRPNGPDAGSGAGQTGTEADGIIFTNVPQVGRIEIYTLDGRLVRKLEIPSGLVLPKLKWDVRTAGGERAASGVYLWRVVSGANSKAGKLMVIW